MKLATILELHCPYCGSSFELSREIDIKGEEIIKAIVNCNCRSYPLVEGILVLKTTSPNAINQALSAIESKQSKKAVFSLLTPRTTVLRIIQGARKRRIPLSNLIDRFRMVMVNRYLSEFTQAKSLTGAFDCMRYETHGGYFRYRFSNTSFVAGIPLILLINDFPGPILEIGSGMGHQGFVISQLYPERKLVLVDSSFINLYLAKRFFLPQAEYICLDANDPLPFSDRSFNVIFSSDLFHYLDSKHLAMQEIVRVSAENPLILLSHLHNRSAQNVTPGDPLTAKGWLQLSSFPQTKLLSELRVFNIFLMEDKLDLLSDYADKEMEQANAFAIVGAQQKEVFRVYQKIGERFFNIQNHLIVNPLYQISMHSDKVLLRKKWPSAFMQVENITMDKILPDTYTLDKGLLEEIIKGEISKSNSDRVNGLMRKFILVNVPENF